MLVIDDGDGIQEENIDKIFDFEFTTTNGSGIGLSSIKKTISDMHNADISVKSDKGEAFFKIFPSPILNKFGIGNLFSRSYDFILIFFGKII
jgi:signal transduction histidine kinase